ncbi:hypothetical protein DFH08DRAFT_1085919 [Mycena albidolilacea]|uniref:Uncharacterized protein n=1 Tax=Mycena albidolilacea TaxID=1033008 RepID=A0AAD6ZFX9_9AGAR|nr:hypothetical protein DFH08DRAFT_1085919 [Mycena albidolilacea]
MWRCTSRTDTLHAELPSTLLRMRHKHIYCTPHFFTAPLAPRPSASLGSPTGNRDERKCTTGVGRALRALYAPAGIHSDGPRPDTRTAPTTNAVEAVSPYPIAYPSPAQIHPPPSSPGPRARSPMHRQGIIGPTTSSPSMRLSLLCRCRMSMRGVRIGGGVLEVRWYLVGESKGILYFPGHMPDRKLWRTSVYGASFSLYYSSRALAILVHQHTPLGANFSGYLCLVIGRRFAYWHALHDTSRGERDG